AAFIARVLVRVARGVAGRVADVDGLHHALRVGADRLAVVEGGARGICGVVRVQVAEVDLRLLGVLLRGGLAGVERGARERPLPQAVVELAMRPRDAWIAI